MPKKKTKEVEVLPARKFNDHFESWMCEEIIKVGEKGGHQPAMCLAIGIKSRDTFRIWRQKHPELEEAWQYAKLASQAFYEELGLRGLAGLIKGFNFNSYAMTMNNKFGDDYSRGANGPSTQVTIGSINSIEKLDTDALDKKIKQLLGDTDDAKEIKG